jgi:hypothetical protein
MRTKTLLIAAAALVAGVVSSEAQVYSANIVGYVNFVSSTNAPAYEVINNPLDNGVNTLKSLFPSAPGGTSILIWRGAGYDTAVFSAAQGGHWKTNGVTADNALIPVGTGLFVSVSGTSILTNTFVGNVVVPTGTTATNTVGGGLQLVGSAIPYADFVTNPATINISGVVGGTSLLLWNKGNQGFDTYTWSAAQGGHWKLNGVNTTPFLNVNQGFFFDSAAAYNWAQTLP